MFKRLENKLNRSNLNGYYKIFNNCREEGLSLTIYEHERSIVIWACECRNSDHIMVVLGTEDDIDINGMFNEKIYNKAKYFKYKDYDSAVDYIYKHIKYVFQDKMNFTAHYKFNTYKSMEEIRKIQYIQETLDYEDYYDLATFIDEDNNYICDLIILNGKMGLRYSKINDDEIENLKFEAYNPNFENEVILMSDMNKKLSEFLYNGLEYAIEKNKTI